MTDANTPEVATLPDGTQLRTVQLGAPRSRMPRLFMRAGLPVADGVMLLLALVFASLIRFGSVSGLGTVGGPNETALAICLEYLATLLPLFALAGLYTADHSWGSADLSQAVRAIALGTAAFVLIRFLLHATMPSREWLLLVGCLATALVAVERLSLRAVLSHLHGRGRLLRRTLVVGTNSEAACIVRSLLKRPSDGFAPVGCLASSLKDRLSLDYTAPVLPTLGTARDVLSVVREQEIDVVVLISSAFDHEVLERIIAELSGARVDVCMSSSLSDVLLSRVKVREVAGVPLISLRGISLSPANLLVKRTFDLVVACAIIVIGLPLWLVVAALIKLTSPGKVLYVQERIGLRGTPFGMYKFRTMVSDADTRLDELRSARGIASGPIFKLQDDPRVTSIGRWMRKYSIDEFPQLINVVRGDMSLVGPRPPLPAETTYYGDRHWRRFEVVPGMTGLWQVSGRSRLTFDEMVDMDLFYIGNWALALDMSILVRTVPAVILSKGAW